MSNHVKEKFSFILKCCLAFALLVAAAMFSIVFDWHESTILVSSTGNPLDSLNEPCKEGQKTAAAPASAEVLRPLDPTEEELISKDRVLASAEVLGLNEGIDQLETIGKPATPPAKAAAIAHSRVDQRDEKTAQQSLLPAPENTVPLKAADVRRQRYVRLHWDSVPGAQAYEIKAWQVDGAMKISVIETKTPDTEIRVEPKIQGAALHWQVAAVDAKGHSGEVAGPIAVDLLGKPESHRTPASSQGRNWWPRR